MGYRTSITAAETDLHIDDPTLVILQKISEQKRRDGNRSPTNNDIKEEEHRMKFVGIGFAGEMNIPWSLLLKDRGYKDELPSLHILCGAVATFDILEEYKMEGAVFLQGGSFVLPYIFSNCKLSQLKPQRDAGGNTKKVRNGRIILTKTEDEETDMDSHFKDPRSRCVAFESNGSAFVGSADIRYGEAETRFAAVTREYIYSSISIMANNESIEERDRRSRHGERNANCQTEIISDETDVILNLLSNACMYGREVLHLLNDSVHDLDASVDILHIMYLQY